MGNIIYMSESKVSKLLATNPEIMELLFESPHIAREDAIKLAQKIEEERSAYLRHVDNISVQRQINIEDYKRFVGKLPDLSEGEDLSTLHTIGFNTSKPLAQFTQLKKIPGPSKVTVIQVIIGQERLDKRWLTLRNDHGVPYSSEEARDYVRKRRDASYHDTITEEILGKSYER